MNRVSAVGMAGMVLVLAAGRAGAQAPPEPPGLEHAEAKQLVAIVERAAELVAQQGESAFAAFRSPDGEFRKGDLYVFVNDMDGINVVHPTMPEIEGQSFLDVKDEDGKPVLSMFVSALARSPDAWVHYRWPKPGQAEKRWKSSYLKKVQTPAGKTYMVGAGLYDMKPEKRFVVEMVDGAADLIRARGRDAFPTLRSKSSRFVALGTYVFVLDPNGVEVVNAAFPELEGKNMMDEKDSEGTQMVRAMFDGLKEREALWVDYLWPKPGEKTTSRKSSYVRKVAAPDGETFVVGAGLYLD